MILSVRSICFIFLLSLFFSTKSFAQNSTFLVLGDLHYDRLEDHDMGWLGKKPDDLRQVTEEYTVYTKNNWIDFMGILKQKVLSEGPAMKAIIQLGDLSEGLAGSPDKARQMAGNAMMAVENAKLEVPWILVKGNHDVTGPGATEAFQEYYVPMIRRQTNNREISKASYSYTVGDVQITCLDPRDKQTDMVSFLENEFSASKAKFEFVAIHEPVIPVTERCWHILRTDTAKRERLLEVIAKNHAIVLCGHLHRYSIVSRNTRYGPVVQVMAISVVRNRDYINPTYLISEYGPSLATNVPDWQPATLEERKAILSEEAKHVTYYKQTDLPGYAVLRTDSKKGSVNLEYYAAFGRLPYDKVDLTQLMK
jgi:3',5'-cyclic AMP phosphodiesterase CpdA